MGWSPLGGFHKLDEQHPLRVELQRLSEAYNCTESELVLAWLLKHPAHIHPVLGTTSERRINEALNSLELQLSLQDWFVLYEASRGKEVD